MTDPVLTADCALCADLCCVALAFDKSDQFAIDKPSGVPCQNLETCGGCSIHKNLEKDGYKGCTIYTCNGAGQRTTQEVFKGEIWQDRPELLKPMMQAFQTMRMIHEFLILLGEAGKLPLTAAHKAELGNLRDMLAPSSEWTPALLSEFETGPAPADIRSFMKSLRQYIPRNTG